MVAPAPYTLSVDGKSMPYQRTVALGTGSSSAVYAIVVVHGSSRTAESYYDAVADGTASAGRTSNTVIVAPQFLLLEDLTAAGLSTSTWHYWSNDGWKSGNTSSNGSTSSYAVMDYILGRLCDITLYPNLQYITVTGHSAGGQLSARYGPGTMYPNSARAGVKFKWVIANPSSYMYLSKERPVGRSTTEFYIPSVSEGTYNTYKYGFLNLNLYMGNTGSTQIRTNYENRNIDIIVGEEDIYRDSDLDTSTSGDYQGYNRFERGYAFHSHVVRQFGVKAHNIWTVPNVGHSPSIWRASVGYNSLFDFSDAPTEPEPPPPPSGPAYTVVGISQG